MLKQALLCVWVMLGLVLALVPLFGYALGWPPVADAYLCVTDQATGFSYNKKADEWQPANYKVKDLKYVIKRDGAAKPWAWSSFGSTSEPVTCEDDVYARENIVVVCHDRHQYASFSLRSRRFQLYTHGNYLQSTPEDDRKKDKGQGTPLIELGTCSPIAPTRPALD